MGKKLEEYLPYAKFEGAIETALPVVLGSTLAVTGAVSFSTAPTGDTFFASYFGPPTEAATDRVFFVATRACTVVAISQVHAVAAGGASTLQVVKDTGTDAPGAGTNLLTNNTNAGFDLNATANTVQVGTLSATAADLVLAAGNRLAIDFANTVQSTAGLVVTVQLKTS